MDYDTYLAEQFGDLEINLVSHDASFGGCPAKIVVQLGKMPKDRGETAKDLSNYLYRLGLRFETVPEYKGRGKTTTLTFYMSAHHVTPILPNIWAAVQPLAKPRDYVPHMFSPLIIQNTKRGVYPRTA